MNNNFTDKELETIAEGTFRYMLFVVNTNNPNVALEAFASVMFYMKNAFNCNDKQYLYCTKCNIRELEKAMKTTFEDSWIENTLVPKLKNANVDINLGSKIIDAVLEMYPSVFR